MKRLLFAFLLSPFFTQAQIIVTVAGNGIGGFSGDNGTATAAAFGGINGVDLDDSGNLYICDQTNSRIRKVKPAIGGIVTTIVGNGFSSYGGDGGPGTFAKIAGARDVALDHHGNVYIADVVNNRVRKLNAAGIITTIAGTGIPGFNGDNIPATDAHLHYPFSVAVDDSDNLYIADQRNYRIRKVNPAGIITTIAGTGMPGYSGDGGNGATAQILLPYSVVTDKKGDVYFSDSLYLRKIDTVGKIITLAGNGTVGVAGDNGPATAAQMVAVAIAVDTFGNIYMAAEAEDRVRKITIATGIITTIAGTGYPFYNGDGGDPDTTNICNPNGIVVSMDGDIFIGDYCNSRVRMITNKPLNVKGINSEEPGITVFPNPNHESCTIHIGAPGNAPAQITVINSAGVEVYHASIPINTTSTIQTSWPPGSYTVTASVGAQRFTKQIVVL